MRFDDMIETCLAWQAEDAPTRARLRRQLADMLARTDGTAPPELISRARARIAEFVATAPAMEQGPAASRPLASPETDEIGDLLARIEAFRARGMASACSSDFAFTIDEHGLLRDAQGRSLPAQLAPEPVGIDGQVVGAWREGRPIADARLTLAEGPHAGNWRISADPLRDGNGRLIGYRGVARLPRPDEQAGPLPEEALPAAPTPSVTILRFDRAVRAIGPQLTAIGNVSDLETITDEATRRAAMGVVERSADLVDAVDAFARAMTETDAEPGRAVDAAAILGRLHAALFPLAETRGVALSFRLARELPPIDAAPRAVERMMTRLLAATLSLGQKGERLVVRLGRSRDDGRLAVLSVSRPGRLAGRDRARLLDPPTVGPAQAPALALGFALRLVERLAAEEGGTLVIHEDRFVLALPLASLASAARG